MRISHGLRAALAGQVAPPAPTNDPNFENVSLLLHGDGTNGAQNNTFTDGSANNFTITRNGNTTQGTFSPFSPTGWSGYFDGTGDYLTYTYGSDHAFGTGDFTIEWWLYSTNANNAFFQGDTNQGWGASLISGTFYWQSVVNVTNLLTASVSAYLTPQWRHWAIVRSSGTLKLYIDGTQIASVADSTNYSDASGTMTVGYYPAAPKYLNGYMSNLRVVTGTAVYTSAFTPPTSPLTAITNTSLLTLQDNRFKDNSTNNFTITRNGDTKIEAFSPFNPTAAYSASTHGGSGYFQDAVADYLTTPSSAQFNMGTGDWTVEGWFYGNKVLNQFNVAWHVGTINATDGMSGSVASNSVGFRSNGTTDISASISIANQWAHIAWVKVGSSNTVTIYVNGASVASGTYSNSIATGTFTCGFAMTSFRYGGYISNLRVLKGTALYTSAFTPPTAPLTAITNTSLLLNFTNGGIIDNASKNVLETVGNAQISTSVTKFGTGSMYFDGTGDYLKGPSNSLVSWTSENFTIEGWINFIVGSNWTTVEKGLDWGLLADANRWVYKSNQTNVFVISWAPSLNTWYHFACVRNGSTTTMYINGSSIGSGTSVNAASTTAPITVGYSLGFNGYALNGYIDDLRITKGVARYTANFTPPTQAFFDL